MNHTTHGSLSDTQGEKAPARTMPTVQAAFHWVILCNTTHLLLTQKNCLYSNINTEFCTAKSTKGFNTARWYELSWAIHFQQFSFVWASHALGDHQKLTFAKIL